MRAIFVEPPKLGKVRHIRKVMCEMYEDSLAVDEKRHLIYGMSLSRFLCQVAVAITGSKPMATEHTSYEECNKIMIVLDNYAKGVMMYKAEARAAQDILDEIVECK